MLASRRNKLLLAALIALPVAAALAAPRKDILPLIYDRTADGEKQVADAVSAAQRDHKRILIQFGADWCIWCHRLHDLCKSDKALAHELLYEYVVVHIDVGDPKTKPNNQATLARFGNPNKNGIPVLMVLDETGKPLTTQDTGAFEEGKDHHGPAKVLAFLQKWQATPPSADAALAAALSKAKSESKAVFVDFAAPWCGWCKRFDAYARRPEIAGVLDAAYVSVKIDVDRMKGGKAMQLKYTHDKETGIPFFVILDAGGKTLADSFGPKGNIGYPGDPDEIAHFLKMIRRTAPKLSEEQVAKLEKPLKGKRPRP